MFFKPAGEYGSKAVYRGDKVTKGVWAEIIRGRYVAQEFAAPSERMVKLDGSPQARKTEVRLYDLAQRRDQFGTLSNQGFAISNRDLLSMPRLSIAFFILWMASSLAWSQAASTIDDASNGRHLAVMLCTGCHVVAPGQPYAPTMNPPAASFQSIAQRAGTTVESLRNFLTTTHHGLDNPNGMPDPMLADFQIREISAYVLSLRR